MVNLLVQEVSSKPQKSTQMRFRIKAEDGLAGGDSKDKSGDPEGIEICVAGYVCLVTLPKCSYH